MLGIWPLIMGITMFVQMRLNPTPPDPTQAMIFTWMPVIFTFMLASFPAGLVIYWAWNNTLSVLQQYIDHAAPGRRRRSLRQHPRHLPQADSKSRGGSRGGCRRSRSRRRRCRRRPMTTPRRHGVQDRARRRRKAPKAQAARRLRPPTGRERLEHRDDERRRRRIVAARLEAGRLALRPALALRRAAPRTIRPCPARRHRGRLRRALQCRQVVADQRARRPEGAGADLEHAGPDAASWISSPPTVRLTIVDMPGYGYARAPKATSPGGRGWSSTFSAAAKSSGASMS